MGDGELSLLLGNGDVILKTMYPANIPNSATRDASPTMYIFQFHLFKRQMGYKRIKSNYFVRVMWKFGRFFPKMAFENARFMHRVIAPMTHLQSYSGGTRTVHLLEIDTENFTNYQYGCFDNQPMNYIDEGVGKCFLSISNTNFIAFEVSNSRFKDSLECQKSGVCFLRRIRFISIYKLGQIPTN